MLRMFNFENRFSSIVKETIERLLCENDLSTKSVFMQKNIEKSWKESPNFFVMTSDNVDEGLAGKLIREFDWASIGVEVPAELAESDLAKNDV